VENNKNQSNHTGNGEYMKKRAILLQSGHGVIILNKSKGVSSLTSEDLVRCVVFILRIPTIYPGLVLFEKADENSRISSAFDFEEEKQAMPHPS
jgi:hypothetical protein